jgi:hypothetical protein
MLSLSDIQGVVVGALINMPMSDRLGLGNVSFLESFFFLPQLTMMIDDQSSDARSRVSRPDCCVSFPVSCTPLSGFRFIFCSRWDWSRISGQL